MRLFLVIKVGFIEILHQLWAAQQGCESGGGNRGWGAWAISLESDGEIRDCFFFQHLIWLRDCRCCLNSWVPRGRETDR